MWVLHLPLQNLQTILVTISFPPCLSCHPPHTIVAHELMLNINIVYAWAGDLHHLSLMILLGDVPAQGRMRLKKISALLPHICLHSCMVWYCCALPWCSVDVPSVASCPLGGNTAKMPH